MCLIVLGLGIHPELPLLFAGNRDEFFARPTRPAAFWDDHPEVLAGRDLEQGGTWFGVTKQGRLAAITNFRDGRRPRSGRRSRGLLVSDFLLSDQSPAEFLEQLERTRDDYDGFNLVFGQAEEFFHYSNRSTAIARLTAGVYGLSNHLLDTPWPKVERAKAALKEASGMPREAVGAQLEKLLQDDARAPDDTLPQTGVSLEWERLLSSAFIRSPAYGTRASTTLTRDTSGEMVFVERSFGPDGQLLDLRSYRISPTS
ncbi:MAG TPA: NRDE family protein [Burkholderiales bacterium]|nr:NRDE family protein [Burkholderiales bacterium]